MSGCAIAAIVVGLIVVLGAIAVGVTGYVFVQKVGGRNGVMKSTFGAANPDYEILEYNERAQTLTVKHKKTGKTATIPFSHLKNGRIDPADLGLTAEEAEGTAGAPEWVKYPGGKVMASAHLLGMTTLVYLTDDSVEDAIGHYRSVLKDRGMQAVERKNGSFAINDSNGSLAISVTPGRDGKTMVTVVFKER